MRKKCKRGILPAGLMTAALKSSSHRLGISLMKDQVDAPILPRSATVGGPRHAAVTAIYYQARRHCRTTPAIQQQLRRLPRGTSYGYRECKALDVDVPSGWKDLMIEAKRHALAAQALLNSSYRSEVDAIFLVGPAGTPLHILKDNRRET